VKELAKKYDVKYCLDYDELLKDPKIDAVVLAVPTPLHFTYAMRAIYKGKHVPCEMPIAPTVKETKQLAEKAKKEKIIFMPVSNFRFAPTYVKVKEIIQSGKFS